MGAIGDGDFWQQRYNKMVVWCLQGNEQGRNFYKKMGGNSIGERSYELNGLKIKVEGFIYNLI